jgi:soluble lytic murein transglycosylase
MEDIPYYETKKYVQKVLTSYAEYLRTSNEFNQERLAKIIKYKGGD